MNEKDDKGRKMKMSRFLKLRTGKKLEVWPTYYAYNRTLAIALFEEGELYGNLTCCLDDAPGRNCAYIDVNYMGVDIVDVLEEEGFGKRTGKKHQSGYVVYPEFSFKKEVLRDCTNENYEKYLTWQETLGEDEEYLTASCRICYKDFCFTVKKEEAQKYREYQDGAPYLIQNVFPNMSCEERGLFAKGQNMCGTCFKEMFSFYQGGAEED